MIKLFVHSRSFEPVLYHGAHALRQKIIRSLKQWPTSLALSHFQIIKLSPKPFFISNDLISLGKRNSRSSKWWWNFRLDVDLLKESAEDFFGLTQWRVLIRQKHYARSVGWLVGWYDLSWKENKQIKFTKLSLPLLLSMADAIAEIVF